VLEHVSGGELFDYLVKKGRLTPKELNISCSLTHSCKKNQLFDAKSIFGAVFSTVD
jgi:hypothetical protein